MTSREVFGLYVDAHDLERWNFKSVEANRMRQTIQVFPKPIGEQISESQCEALVSTAWKIFRKDPWVCLSECQGEECAFHMILRMQYNLSSKCRRRGTLELPIRNLSLAHITSLIDSATATRIGNLCSSMLSQNRSRELESPGTHFRTI